MYSLKRERDGQGDSGGMSLAIWFDKQTGLRALLHNARPKVGVAMRVGSMSARSYNAQDWWQTTEITEILEETQNYVKFKTKNSVYQWWEAE